MRTKYKYASKFVADQNFSISTSLRLFFAFVIGHNFS